MVSGSQPRNLQVCLFEDFGGEILAIPAPVAVKFVRNAFDGGKRDLGALLVIIFEVRVDASRVHLTSTRRLGCRRRG